MHTFRISGLRNLTSWHHIPESSRSRFVGEACPQNHLCQLATVIGLSKCTGHQAIRPSIMIKMPPVMCCPVSSLPLQAHSPPPPGLAPWWLLQSNRPTVYTHLTWSSNPLFVCDYSWLNVCYQRPYIHSECEVFGVTAKYTQPSVCSILTITLH